MSAAPMDGSRGREVAVLAVGTDPGDLPGCTVETAEDLLGALARLSGGGIDVVYTLLELPDATGTDAIASVRDRAPEAAIVAITQDAAEAGAAMDAGATDVLPADAGRDLVARSLRYAATLKRMEGELDRRETIDPVTGLHNARGFEQLATHHLRVSDRTREPVTLVFVRLEEANGEPDDRALAEAARALVSAVRLSDVTARVGADVFCVLLAGSASNTDVTVLPRIVEAIAGHDAETGTSRGASVAIGSVTYDPQQPQDLHQLMAEADRRMRRPREAGVEPGAEPG